jgi:MFS family permease
MDRGASTTRKLGLLSSLYFSQGVPYGFFVTALPALMRQQGLSLANIGLSSLLMLPWALKIFVAPFVDKHRGSKLGARRGWIIPLQWLTIASVALLAILGKASVPIEMMALACVITAALAATQDCATDGLAVTLLSEKERGHGNGVQVAAYRIGMVIGGGLLLAVFDLFGWFATFGAMALFLALATIPIARFREPAPTPEPAGAHVSLVSSTVAFLSRPRMGVWLLLLALYKLGDTIGSPMVKPLLVDRGMSLATIGFVSGTLGSGVALLGALAGGWLAARRGRAFALWWGGITHAVLMAGYALASADMVGATALSALLVLEHFTGSIATVALFTVMMDASDEKTGATDYTIQATWIVWITAGGAVSSGFTTEAIGYSRFFVVSALVCAVGTIALVWALRRGFTPPLFVAPPLASVSAAGASTAAPSSAAASASAPAPSPPPGPRGAP